MQDNAESTENAPQPSTVLAEVLPGMAVVFGDVPAGLNLELVDFGLVPDTDRTRISTFLATLGHTAAVAGDIGTALAGMQGLYRLSSTTQALLSSGGALAVKDGANLGAIFANGKIVGQARLIPVSALGAAQLAASVGPALAMIALQMQLNEITGLTRTNIALTNQVITDIRHGQWAELTALVATIDRAVSRAREIGSVPASQWDGIAGSEAALHTQLELYRLNVSHHIRQLRNDPRGRRTYLETNAEAILFDAHALLTSLKAWTGYQVLHATRARDAGTDDEARLAEVIARDTRAALDSALPETTGLVDALTRELRVSVELPGRATLPLSGKRKDAAAVRQSSARLLEAIQPLADALHPPAAPLHAPDAVCAPDSLDPDPYLRILRWFLDDGETLRALALPEPSDGSAPITSVLNGAKGMFGAAREKTLVAVTDRRILTARATAFLDQGEIRQEIPLDLVRYLRVTSGPDKGTRTALDLITRDENIRWQFQADIDDSRVGALAAVLAESMTIPDTERHQLLQPGRPALTTGAAHIDT